jgi:hypothetical protein
VIGAIGPQSTPEDVAKSIPFVMAILKLRLRIAGRGAFFRYGSGSRWSDLNQRFRQQPVLNILPATNLFGATTSLSRSPTLMAFPKPTIFC